MNDEGQIPPRLPARREADRRAERLPTAWVRDAREHRLPQTRVLVRDDRSPLAPATHSDAVIVMLSGACDAAVQAMLDAAKDGARVYVLAPPGWGNGATSPLAELSRASVLVRRVEALPATAVWTGADCHLWTGTTPDRPSWRAALTAHQSQAMRLAMLRLFWHHGIDEAWIDDGRCAFRPCASRPFDVPDATAAMPIRLLPREGSLTMPAASAVYLPMGSGRPTGARRGWTPPSGTSHDELAVLRAAGTRVVWDDLDLPMCGVGDDAGWIEASSSRWSLRVALDEAQRSDLARILDSEPSWHFEADVALGDIERSPGAVVWLADEKSAAPLRPLETVEMGDAPAASLRACTTTEPDALRKPSSLAIQVEWRWNVVPPKMPAKATDHPLVHAWRAFDGAFRGRVDTLSAALADAGARASALERDNAKMRAAVLGFQRTRTELASRLVPLASVPPSSLGKPRAEAQLEALRSLEGDFANHSSALTEAERRSREEREREGQHETHRFNVQRAIADLGRHQAEHAEKSVKLERVHAELRASAGDARNDKDRVVLEKRCSDDIDHLTKRIERLVELIAECRREAGAEFVFQPRVSTAPDVDRKRARGPAFVPEASAEDTLRVPTTSLPAVGRLVVAGDVPYLGIRRWEHLEDGERECERLAARLVAEVEAT